MGMFDDLLPGAPPSGGGLFDDLVPKPKESVPPKEPGKLRGAADTGLSFARGAVQGVKMLSDVAGAGNPVSDKLEGGIKWLSENFSDHSKWEQLTSAQDMKAAELTGSTWEEVKAAARSFSKRPVDFLAEAAGTSLPTIAAAFLPGGQGALLGRVAMLGMGSAQGAGAVKGQIHDTVEEAWTKAGATKQEAKERADAAQSYFGSNTGQIALGAALGGLAGRTGVESAIAGKAATKGMLAKVLSVARGALAEGLPEAAQGGQEQLAGNLALQNEGFAQPTMAGVAGNAALEAMAGGAVGAVAAPFAREVAPAVAPAPPPAVDPVLPILAAGSMDEAIRAATDAVRGPKAKRTAPRDALDEIRMLDPAEQQEAMGLLATATSSRASDGARRFAQNRLDQLLGPVREVPVGEATEMLPTPDAEELTDEQRAAYVNTPGFIDRTRMQRGIPAGEATDAIPAGEAAEVEPIPAGEATEEIPAPDAYEELPTGEATEVIPAGESMDVPSIPAGQATEIEPETVQDSDYLTTDGMPYGSKTAANVRARREGLGPANVIEIPGAGWVVRPQPKTLGRAPIAAQPAGTRGTNAGDVVKAPARDVVPSGLLVTFGGKTYPVESIEDAQAKWIAFRESSGAGVSGIGNGIRVTDGAGRFVARISYNGRAWDGEDTRAGGGKVIAEAPEALKAPDVPDPARPAGPRPADTGRSDGAGVLPVVQPGDVAAGSGGASGQGVDGGGAAGPGGAAPGALTAPKRLMGGYGSTLTIAEAVAKARELDAESRAKKKAAGAAKTAMLRDIDLNAASAAAGLARTLRKDIQFHVQSYPDARAEYERLNGDAPPNAAAPAEKAPEQSRVPEAAAPTLADRIKQRRAEKAAPAPVAPTTATHKDPGQPAEPATAPVIAQALGKAARKEALSRAAMKAEALRLVDAAIATAKDESDPDVMRLNERSKAKPDMQALRRRGLTGTALDKAAAEIQRQIDADKAKAADNIGFVTIKVPGDGEFKVINTKERLTAFRKKVEASPGFKDQRTTGMPPNRVNGYGMKVEPGSPFGVETGSGPKSEAFANMVEDGDLQAALDYAQSVGIDPKTAKLSDVLRKRLDKFMRDEEMAAAVAAREPAAPAPQPEVDAQYRQDATPAPARDDAKIELRKRLSVLKSLKECIG